MKSLHSTAILKKFEFLQPFSRPLRKLKKSCFALELNWKQKVCLQQPAMFCLSNSNIQDSYQEHHYSKGISTHRLMGELALLTFLLRPSNLCRLGNVHFLPIETTNNFLCKKGRVEKKMKFTNTSSLLQVYISEHQ